MFFRKYTSHLMGDKMNKQDKIQNEIDKTMGLLDKTESLPPNPYFYTRVKQRLNEKSRKKHPILGILKPVLFTALIALNLTTAIWYINTDANFSEDADLELVDLLKSDLNLDNDQSESLIFE